MNSMGKTVLVYFSATGNTKACLEAMAKAVSDSFETIDLTLPANVRPCRFAKDDLVLFGAPVYAGRTPTVARQRLEQMQGDGTLCLVVASYGNRHYDDALLELADMAEAQGFVVKGGAAVIGRHTYGEIQVSRPDADDLAACASFAKEALAQPDHPIAIPGNRPYRDGGSGGRFRPLTNDACVQCGLCVRNCPVAAIAEDCRTVADCCIACFRCIRSCPASAKHTDTPAYNEFAAEFTQRLKQRRENEFFL